MKTLCVLRVPKARRLAALLCALVLALGVALPRDAALATRQSFGVVYGTDTLNLRADASSSSRWLGSYARGTWVTITGAKNNFYYVTGPDGNTGYMSKNFIDVTGDDNQTHTVAMVRNANGGAFLNFRANPSYSAKVLGIFYDGVPLYLLGQSDSWYHVELNGQQGYVRGEYVYLESVPASASVATIKTPNNTAMNLRDGPGTGYAVAHQVRGDRYVMVLAQGTSWWRVSVDGYTGFMSKDFLSMGLNSAKDIAARKGGGGESYAVVANPKSTQSLNLRQQASIGAEVVTRLYNGTELRVDAQGAEWSMVTVKDSGLSGFAMTKYLRLYNLPATPTRTVRHPNGSYVNLRAQPDMTYGKTLCRVPSGKSVTILAPGVEWCKVKYNGQTGYMLSYFLP